MSAVALRVSLTLPAGCQNCGMRGALGFRLELLPAAIKGPAWEDKPARARRPPGKDPAGTWLRGTPRRVNLTRTLSREATLAALLVSLFSEDELRIYLKAGPEGEDLAPSLPGSGSTHATLASKAVEALVNRGLVDRAFFDRLQSIRSRRSEEIRRVRNQWLEGGTLDRDALWAEGRYKLVESIGGGGFGLVWRAVDTTTGASVALKILLEQHAGDARMRQRFFRGASVLAKMMHTAIVRVESAALQEGIRSYYVMEFIRGDTLESLVKQGSLTRAELIALVLEIGGALAYVHERDLLHRDVKPSNILVVRGRAKLIDFDLVAGEDFCGITTKALGTLLYTPPEAHTSDPKRPAYDVFSLARTAEYVLRGREPTIRELADVAIDLDVAAAVKEVLRAALRQDPAERTPTVQAFCADLRAAMESATTEGTPAAGPSVARVRALIPMKKTAIAPASVAMKQSSHPPSGPSRLWWFLPFVLSGSVLGLAFFSELASCREPKQSESVMERLFDSEQEKLIDSPLTDDSAKRVPSSSPKTSDPVVMEPIDAKPDKSLEPVSPVEGVSVFRVEEGGPMALSADPFLRTHVKRDGEVDGPAIEFAKSGAIASNAVTVVKLWATWCSPCKVDFTRFRTMLSLNRRHRAWGNEVRVVPILVDDEGNERTAYSKWSSTIPDSHVALIDQQLDHNGVRGALEDIKLLRPKWAVLPVTLLFDCRRRIRWFKIGALDDAALVMLANTIDELRAELSRGECKPKPNPNPATFELKMTKMPIAPPAPSYKLENLVEFDFCNHNGMCDVEREDCRICPAECPCEGLCILFNVMSSRSNCLMVVPSRSIAVGSEVSVPD